MSEQHTAAPWRTDPDVGNESVLGADGIMVADCAIFTMRNHRRNPEINQANARLIAAAPDLLSALEEITDYRGGAANAFEDEYVMERVRDAIAKARGEAR